MNLDEFLKLVSSLGPWKLVGPTGMIRGEVDDLCPLVAVAVKVNRKKPTSCDHHLRTASSDRLAIALAVPDALADNLMLAADGTVKVDPERLQPLRIALIAACGLASEEASRLANAKPKPPLIGRGARPPVFGAIPRRTKR